MAQLISDRIIRKMGPGQLPTLNGSILPGALILMEANNFPREGFGIRARARIWNSLPRHRRAHHRNTLPHGLHHFTLQPGAKTQGRNRHTHGCINRREVRRPSDIFNTRNIHIRWICAHDMRPRFGQSFANFRPDFARIKPQCILIRRVPEIRNEDDIPARFKWRRVIARGSGNGHNPHIRIGRFLPHNLRLRLRHNPDLIRPGKQLSLKRLHLKRCSQCHLITVQPRGAKEPDVMQVHRIEN